MMRIVGNLGGADIHADGPAGYHAKLVVNPSGTYFEVFLTPQALTPVRIHGAFIHAEHPDPPKP